MSKLQILQIENQLLREQLDTLRGVQKPYRAVERETGAIADFDTAQALMDHLFAVGGHDALRRFWLYKDRRRVLARTTGGEVGALARRLERL